MINPHAPRSVASAKAVPLFIAAGLSSLLACGARSSGKGADDTGSDSDDRDDFGGGADFDAGLRPNSDRDPFATPEKLCGTQTIPLDRLPAELLMVLDRSSSMVSESLNDMRTHWEVTTAAIDESIKDTEAGVMWGLKMFPTNTGCSISNGVELDVALNNHGRIAERVRRATPPPRTNGTPTTMGMKAAAAYLAARTTPNPKFILLATDGAPTCANGTTMGPDTPAAIQSVADAAKAGFHTFVVGIAAQRQSGEAAQTLNAMAVAGQQAREGDTKFYSVTSQDELTKTLGSIAGQVGSCSFALNKAPPAPDNVAVDVGGMRIPRSDTDGWQYGPNQKSIVLNGPPCAKVKSGELKGVEIKMGCPDAPVL